MSSCPVFTPNGTTGARPPARLSHAYPRQGGKFRSVSDVVGRRMEGGNCALGWHPTEHRDLVARVAHGLPVRSFKSRVGAAKAHRAPSGRGSRYYIPKGGSQR